MVKIDSAQVRRILRERCPVIAEEWHQAIMHVSYSLPDKMQARQEMHALTERTIDLLLAEPFEPGPARAVGETLASLHYIQPELLSNTGRVLNRSVFEDLSPDQAAALQPRLTLLLGELAAGFFGRAREIILDEQEQIRWALLTARRKAERALTWQSGINAAVAELSKSLLRRADIEDISVLVLDVARHLTGSALGFVGYVDSQSGDFVCPAQSGRVWKTRQTPKESAEMGDLQGLRGWVLHHREPVLVNTPAQDPRWATPPASHVPIRRFLSVPALLDEKLVGQLAVANADRDYSEEDLSLIERLASLYALAVQRIQVEQRLQEAQERLVRSERLAAIGELAASVAHELRNPLSVIHTSVYYIKGKLSGADPKVLRSFGRLERQLAAAERIIRDLLAFAHVRNPQLRPTDLNEIVRRALGGDIVPASVTVETRLAEDLPQIMLDPEQMSQVFRNLITNAVQAMADSRERGGKRRLVLTTASADDRILVSVGDAGEGIPDQDLPHIFEPLFTTKAQGTGLGLAICRRIVEAHGGHIEVQSQVGQGSKFTVWLSPSTRVDRG